MKKKNEKTIEPVFDARSASHFQAKVAGTSHHAYKDATGNVCLVCVSSSTGGGVAVNEKALDWLREQPGVHFVRLTNSMSGFDRLFYWITCLQSKCGTVITVVTPSST